MHRLRRLRGLLGIVVAWGALWIPLGLAVAVVSALAGGRGTVRWGDLAETASVLGIVGAVCGFFFGLVLAAAERRRGFAQLTFLRMVTWGFAGSMVIPAGFVAFNFAGMRLTNAITALATYGVLGGISAVVTFALARRAPAADAEAPP